MVQKGVDPGDMGAAEEWAFCEVTIVLSVIFVTR